MARVGRAVARSLAPTIHSVPVEMSKAASSWIADPGAGLHTYLTHIWPRRRETPRARDDLDSRCMFIMKDFDIYVEVTAPSPPAGAGRASRCSSCSGPTSQGLKTRFTPAQRAIWPRETGRDDSDSRCMFIIEDFEIYA